MSSTCGDRGTESRLARLRLCMVVHVGDSEGSYAWHGWTVGQIGESAHPGQWVSAKDRHSDADQFDVRTPTMSGPFNFRTASVQ